MPDILRARDANYVIVRKYYPSAIDIVGRGFSDIESAENAAARMQRASDNIQEDREYIVMTRQDAIAYVTKKYQDYLKHFE